jgi:hypothetical protein
MTHSQIKKTVALSLMWSMTEHMRKERIPFKNIFKEMICLGAIHTVLKITLNECDKVKHIMNDVEEIKVATWKDLAHTHYNDEVDTDINIPTIIEEIFYANFEWMSKIKNLQRNIEIISMNLIDDTANPKETRIAIDRYNDIVSGNIYRFMKEKKEMVA